MLYIYEHSLGSAFRKTQLVVAWIGTEVRRNPYVRLSEGRDDFEEKR